MQPNLENMRRMDELGRACVYRHSGDPPGEGEIAALLLQTFGDARGEG